MRPVHDQARTVIWLLFTIAHLRCALRHDDVREVVALPALDRPPATPRAVAGILNLAGTAVPVVRLDRLLNLPDSPPGAYQSVILLRQADPPLGLLVDRATDVATFPDEAAIPVDGDQSFNGCVTAQASHDGSTVHLLSATRLLEVRERQVLAEFQALQQHRLDELSVAM